MLVHTPRQNRPLASKPSFAQAPSWRGPSSGSQLHLDPRNQQRLFGTASLLAVWLSCRRSLSPRPYAISTVPMISEERGNARSTLATTGLVFSIVPLTLVFMTKTNNMLLSILKDTSAMTATESTRLITKWGKQNIATSLFPLAAGTWASGGYARTNSLSMAALRRTVDEAVRVCLCRNYEHRRFVRPYMAT